MKPRRIISYSFQLPIPGSPQTFQSRTQLAPFDVTSPVHIYAQTFPLEDACVPWRLTRVVSQGVDQTASTGEVTAAFVPYNETIGNVVRTLLNDPTVVGSTCDCVALATALHARSTVPVITTQDGWSGHLPSWKLGLRWSLAVVYTYNPLDTPPRGEVTIVEGTPP